MHLLDISNSLCYQWGHVEYTSTGGLLLVKIVFPLAYTQFVILTKYENNPNNMGGYNWTYAGYYAKNLNYFQQYSPNNHSYSYGMDWTAIGI